MSVNTSVCGSASDREYIFHAMLLALGVAVVLTISCALLCPWILHILSVPAEIYRDAYRYQLVIFLGIPFTILYNLLSSILRSVGDSRTPFVFLAISTILNIGLDFFCILVLNWGCAGAAIATITAQALSGIMCVIFVWKKVTILKPAARHCILEANKIKNLLLMGLPMGLQFSITAIGSMVMQSANNSLGSVCVSGFTAGMRIKQFLMCPYDAVGSAVSVFCGQNLGAGKTQRIRTGIRDALIIAVGYSVIAGIIMIVFGRNLSLLFVSKKAVEVLDASAKYLRYMGYFFWCLALLNICRMSVQGLGFSGRAIFSGVTEMVARCVVSLGFVSHYGYTAICCADQTAWAMACLYIVPMCCICVKKVCNIS
ncbi:MATE family efflux transporter [Sporofaciens sp. SGI.106]|uniref:MATE family efflux transporter n=1 Tax=Sporofaciens sp. SGI.106 TaxID=3420568 RepID=UPI003D05B95F